MNKICIAILGYGKNCSQKNKDLAFRAGRELALSGIAVCAGNAGGTFHSAFQGAKSVDGHTVVFLEENNKCSDPSLFDEIFYSVDTDEKHRMIAEQAAGAIVLGGGEGTYKLITRLLSNSKFVVAVMGSGGIVNDQLDKRVTVKADLEDALSSLLNNI